MKHLLILFSILLVSCSSQLPEKPLTESPDEVMCITLYEPVCGELEVQCIKAPCPPIQTTYSNKCEAEKAGAAIIAQGECPETEMAKYDQNSWKDLIDPNCPSFFDGCNNCHRDPVIGQAACTRKFCQEYEKPKCLDQGNLDLGKGVILDNFTQRQMIESPLKVSGVAPRKWFFEGVIPITLLTLEEEVVKQWYGTGPWLDPVEGKTDIEADDSIAFSATIEFESPDTDMGKIRIAQDGTGSHETGIEPDYVETMILWPES